MPIVYRCYFTVGRYHCFEKAAPKYSNWTMFFGRFKWTNPNVSVNGYKGKWTINNYKFHFIYLSSVYLSNGVSITQIPHSFDRHKATKKLLIVPTVFQRMIESFRSELRIRRPFAHRMACCGMSFI